MTAGRISTVTQGLGWALNIAVWVGFVFLASSSIQSSLFLLRRVEFVGLKPSSPLSESQLLDILSLPSSEVQLMDLNPRILKDRLSKNPWIKSSSIQIQLPATLLIQVGFRVPVAVVQGQSGKLSYIDSEGVVFSEIDASHGFDYPILQGFEVEGLATRADALKFLELGNQIFDARNIHSIDWSSQLGFRMQVSFLDRTLWIVLGRQHEEESREMLVAARRVFDHVSKNGLKIVEIRPVTPKKVVVRTVRGSLKF